MGGQGDIILGVLSVLSGLGLVYLVIPAATSPALFAAVAPDFYPMLSAWLMVAAGAGLCVAGTRQARRPVAWATAGRQLMFTLAAALGLGFAVLVMLVAGFIPAGALLLLVLMIAAGERRKWVLATGPVAFPVALWLLFDMLLERPLP